MFRRRVINMDMNELPYDLPVSVKVRALFRMLSMSWNRYPSGLDDELRNLLAEQCGVDAENIILGNGSNELIRLAIMAWGGRGRRIVSPFPAFITYEKETACSGSDALYVPLNENLSLDRSRFLKESENADLTILVNPANPTGETCDSRFITELLGRAKGMVILDEAYVDFSDEDNLDLIKQYNNLVILRTLSKGMGLAAIRLGFGIAGCKVIEEINKVAMPYSPGSLTLCAAIEGVRRMIRLRKRIKRIRRERALLIEFMKEVSWLELYPGNGNFILLRCISEKYRQMFLSCLGQQNIKIRLYSGGILNDWMRVSVGKRSENRRFIACVKQITGGEYGT